VRPDDTAGLVALVPGGGSGIGRATALELAASGARVVVCGRREEPLPRTRGGIESGGGECLDLAAGLGEPEQVEAWWAPGSIASTRSTCSTTTPAGTSRLPPRRSRRTAGCSCRCGPRSSCAARAGALPATSTAAAVAAVSRVATAHPEIAEIEVNPLLALPDGALGLDARVVRAERAA
jgi:NAD(P)-dependent dehydrogenase (short-subunit alcohol dehydrogenase family)